MKCPHCATENSSLSKFCGECGQRLKPVDEDAKPLTPSGFKEQATRTMDSSCFPLRRGRVFAGRYEIIEELGQGGMGCVYRADDSKIGEEVALKLIKPDIAADATTLQRFHNELRTARKITHKNVCRTYHIGEAEGATFITMEFIQGEDLKSTIRRFGPLPISKSISLMRQVCDGLAEAHKLGIIHRDLKPRNIMIDREGNAKVMDFGIARTLKSEGITRKGIAVGTPEYISPEQVEGRPVDQRSDLYSLGITLFEMVTGRVPFEGDSTLAIALKHKTESPPYPREINPDIPESLSRIILKCLEKDPAMRYQSAGELKSALAAMEKDLSTGGELRTPGREEGSSQSRRFGSRTFFLLAFFVVVAVSALVVWLMNGRGEAPQPRTLALMPFRDVSPEGEHTRFCETISEGTTRGLTYSSEIRMRPYSAVKEYARSGLAPQELGLVLDVDFLAEPTIQVLGNKVRISCMLTDVGKNVITSLPFEDEYIFEDLFEIQDDVIHALVENLEVRLNVMQRRIGSRNRAVNQRAVDYYIEGHPAVREYKLNLKSEDFMRAEDNLKAALREEPLFVEALWLLGEIYHSRFVEQDKHPDFLTMIDYYKRAHAINPDLPETNVGLGWAFFYDSDFDKAYKHYRKAMSHGANSPEINNHVAGFLTDLGLYERAAKLRKKAMEIDPTNPQYRENAASCLSKQGRFQEAEDVLRDSLERWPDSFRLRLLLARQLIRMRRLGEAEEEIAKVEAAEPGYPGARLTRGWIHAVSGEREEALAIISGLDACRYTYLIADVYALLGMKREAVDHIQTVIDQGFRELQTYPYRYLYLVNNPFFAGLRSNEKFAEIMRRAEKDFRSFSKKYGGL
jgi:serine/threonine protein kinase/tetratricopeptide (TPR) repeat protein